MKQKADIDKLVADYIGWAKNLSTQYFNTNYLPGLDLDDIVQIGRIGLWRAAQKYDPERSLFSTYAKHWVLGQIRQHVFLTFGNPQSRQKKRRGRIKEGEYVPLPELFEIDIRFSANGTAKKVADKDAVAKALAGVHPMYADILRAYYLEGYTLQEMGDYFGVTREYIRLLRNKGLTAARRAIIGENPRKALYYSIA